ncbi:hypothetical protein MTR67_041506 [Solanum verrucosum]|uniref:Aconitase/3-isopropylmalate dehydratase large subunit alpha/beta/alpha domain-containing protein n=1 Tax=Solanum verrucosum TaxID=315347 RepID=A0AAF0ZQV1_SOLVR|nr:hypothetical protein MTR67_041506 [Solanum verrucosum]
MVAKDGSSDIDLNSWELSTIGIGEKNLLRDVDMVEKFRCPGMDVGFKLNSASLAKQRVVKGRVKGNLSSMKAYDETFLMEDTIKLAPMARRVLCPGRSGLEMLNNAPLYNKVVMAVAGIEPASLTDVTMMFACEKLALKPDMRHMFLKGYLMLMAFNLAVISDVYNYKKNDIKAELVAGVSPDSKLNLLMMEDIVVDVAHFSPNEVSLLVEMSCEYPTRRYGAANIYNNIYMSKDNVTFISDDPSYKFPQDMDYGSPDMMWMNLLNIAIKFHTLDDLREVIRDFRGIPGMLRDISRWGKQSCFTLSYPRSYSISTAIESLAEQFPGVLRNSRIIEQLGAIGKVGCPSDDTLNYRFFNLNLLNQGLKSDVEESNSLLQEWYGIKNCILPVSFGGKLKDMVVKMASCMRSGDTSFLRPQLLHPLPYSASRNTTWAVVHGLRKIELESTQLINATLKLNQMTKAYAWVMGVRETLPKVGLNALCEVYIENLTSKESEFIQLVLGDYDINIKHMLDKELDPRTDELELGCRPFYSSSFPGTRCTVVFDSDGVGTIVFDGASSSMNASESLGVPTPATFGAAAVRTAAVGALSEADVDRLVDVSPQETAHGVAPDQAGRAFGVERAGTDVADTQRAGGHTAGGQAGSGRGASVHGGRGRTVRWNWTSRIFYYNSQRTVQKLSEFSDTGNGFFSHQLYFLSQQEYMLLVGDDKYPVKLVEVKSWMTMTEKLLARTSEKLHVVPGENLWVNVDVLMTNDTTGPGAIGVFKREFGENAKVWDREKVVVIPDHYIFTADERANRNVDTLRDFCNEQNIKYFYDIKDLGNFQANPDYKGVCHIALAQEGHCRPGEVLVGTDSHTCTAGAFGQFASGIGNTDAGFVLGTGKILLKDKTTVHYEPVYSEEQTRFLAEYHFDISKLDPLVAKPHSPGNRALARECEDVKIDRVYIGSCTGGKTEDFMAAAKVFLASSQVHPCMGSRSTLLLGLHEGRGVRVEFCILTGKEGQSSNILVPAMQKEGQIYLASPYTAAASALTGHVTDPRDFLQ